MYEVELILSKLKIVSEEQERGLYLCDKEHSKLLLDYITNLQQENEILNNIINEIQTMCKNEYYKKNTTDIDSIGISNNIWVMIYLKIKELKEKK